MDNSTAMFIVIALLALWNIDLIASLLNLKALDPTLPEEFKGVYDDEKYAKSQDYTRVSERYGIITATYSLTVLLVFWALGGFGYLDSWLRGFGWSETVTGIVFIGVLFLGNTLLNLPFQIYDTFVIEERFGFNKTTPKTFAIDQIKGSVLAALLGLPLLALVIWIFGAVAHAWLWAWLAFTAFQLLMMYLAPTFILPLFNKFSPMEDGELKTRIQEMSKKCDFPLTEIHVMDGSKRSTKSNAFFTGFGKRKKIALFDTLIENHGTDELLGVLAHEIGHFKKKHIIQRMIFSIVQTAVVFFLLGLVTDKSSGFARELFDAFGVEEISIYAGLVFFMLLFAPVSKILGILGNINSRKHEFEADAYAAEIQGTPEHLITALKKLSADNLSNLTPHPFPVFMDYSHPPMIVRLKALRQLEKK
ncbi:M48 family metallopeptidase [Verrucomicrobiaceae bacterium 5K15]|uniref:M48 family metallopeptidase n=1 Tax=Oceaniferula flava TaxID=2800421 RepID=A0AAE2SDN2_9BACT|nr:M48 family metallopeptidase [Oceaniferula flavus]MBK1856458.1 M48 family metallopeptidase [Oceaniferula flavus]MBM1137765.1 M48 family metallopeptidase [Oceaniferula flavus]